MRTILDQVKVTADVRLGSKELTIKEVEELGEGSIIILNKEYSSPIDIYINDKLVAYGEILVVDDKFGVRINEIIEKKSNG